MKCQKCQKPATYHITDIERGKPLEYHFCEEHAKLHLAVDQASEMPDMGELAKEVMGAVKLRDDKEVDDKTCPICQLNFTEFKTTGRLGCPHDYEVFRNELLPLLENIHDETRHAGKVPRRSPMISKQQTTLIQLRNELKRLIASEQYELAAKIRDEISAIEQMQAR